ncbi:MAG TPA: TIGR03663 family protein [Thermoanaerobaculaceae bacterium]|nr:TIGR03663 family protein [Thermoanaerobaculaceae bacterium]HPS79060.1 TIGR03663 family protein [Thermoanaerobaculaceae bacterium]
MSRRERWAWIALVVGALVLRLFDLGSRPPHHDESVHGDFAHALLVDHAYRYDPTYHGPLLFYVTAPIFGLLGESDTSLRLYPVACGVALVALPFFLRRRMGARGAWWAGLCAAISPSFFYYSRFGRNEAMVLLSTAASLSLFWLVRRHGPRLIPHIGWVAALHAISKETIYVISPLIGLASFAAAWRDGLWNGVRKGFFWIDRYRIQIGVAILWAFLVCMTAYTFFFVHPEDALFPLKAIKYWYGQHTSQRVGGPWFYHLPRLALYEFLPIVAALAWCVRRRGRLRPVEVFCLVWGLGSIGMFAYLGEKVPWLLVHQVLPFMPLAGLQLGRTFSPAGRWWSRGLAGIGLVATAWSTLASSFLYPAITPADPHAEMIVFVQTTPEAGQIARKVRALAKLPRDGPVAAVQGEAAWPFSWQWKGLNVYWDLPAEGVRPDVVLCDLDKEEEARKRLGDGYTMRRVPLRAWWVEDSRSVTPGELLRWFLTRRAWSEIGSTDMLVFESSRP